MSIELIQGDCLKEMFDIPDNSVDMVCCDMPYGTTACKWDTVLPLDMLWYHYKRICKDNAAIVLNASQPFTTTLINSNLKWFKHEWIWEKNRGSNFASLKYQPMKEHESICVFSYGVPTYTPIKELRKGSGASRVKYKFNPSNTGKREAYGGIKEKGIRHEGELRHPSTIQKFNTEVGLHPTQKPVALIEYLIKTYTNEGDTVLDNCMGSFTTAIACLNTKRDFVGIELDEHYFQVGKDRLEKHLLTLDYTPEIIYNQA